MDPLTAAVQDMLRTSSADLRATVAGLDAATLNRAPAPDASSLAVLVEHAVSATRALVTSALTGRMDRQRYLTEERAAAFATRDADMPRLLASVDELDRLIDSLVTRAPGDGYAGDVVFEGGAETAPRTRLWSLVHAVEHLREHVGHAQLTRQLLEAEPPR